MNNLNSFMQDIENFSKIWDAAQDKGIFGKTEKEQIPEEENSDNVSFFGLHTSEVGGQLNESNFECWKKIANISEESTPSKKDVKDTAEKSGKTYNPTYNYSLGKDSDPKMDWEEDSKNIEELSELQKKLHSMKAQLAKLSGIKGQDANDNKIKALQKKADELSDSLNGNRVKEKT